MCAADDARSTPTPPANCPAPPKQVQSFLARRDGLIVQAHREGAGVREIARVAGLTHPTVLNILRRDSTGGTRNVDER